MRTRTRFGMIAASAVVMALAIGSFAIVGARDSGVEEPTEIHLLSVGSEEVFLDDNNDLPPFSGGDRFVARETAFDFAAQNKKIGDAVLVCTVLPGKPAGAHCDITLNLKGGSIEASGILLFSSKPSTFAIVGGTGGYKNARGEVTAKEIPTEDDEPSKTDVTVSIIP